MTPGAKHRNERSEAERERDELVAEWLEARAQSHMDTAYDAYWQRKHKMRLEHANKSEALKAAAREIREGKHDSVYEPQHEEAAG